MTIKRVEPLSCAKIAGIIYGALGLLFGALFSLLALLGSAASAFQPGSSSNPVSPMIGGLIGVGAIAFFPILYGIIGFISAWIGAWLYNIVASKVGGIQIEVAQSYKK